MKTLSFFKTILVVVLILRKRRGSGFTRSSKNKHSGDSNKLTGTDPASMLSNDQDGTRRFDDDIGWYHLMMRERISHVNTTNSTYRGSAYERAVLRPGVWIPHRKNSFAGAIWMSRWRRHVGLRPVRNLGRFASCFHLGLMERESVSWLLDVERVLRRSRLHPLDMTLWCSSLIPVLSSVLVR